MLDAMTPIVILSELKKKRTIYHFAGIPTVEAVMHYIDLKVVLAKTRETHFAPLLIAFFLHYFAYYVDNMQCSA